MAQSAQLMFPGLLLAFTSLVSLFPSTLVAAEELQLQPAVAIAEGGSLGTAAADLDGDGRDEYVDTVLGEAVRIHDWHPSVQKFATTTLLGKDQLKQHGPRFGADIAVADFTGDGFPDLVLPDSSQTTAPGRLYLYENPGGKLDQPWKETVIAQFADVMQMNDVEAGDLNGDGRIDIVARDLGKGCHVLMQTASGSWSSPITVPTHPSSGLALADLDQDGDLDLVINGVWIETPDPIATGKWQEHYYGFDWYPEERNLITMRQYGSKVATGDFNRDGRPDIVIANAEQQAVAPDKPAGIQVFLAPDEPEKPRWQMVPLESQHRSWSTLQVADLNGDDRLDILGGVSGYGIDREAPALVTAHFSRGDGSFFRVPVNVDSRVYQAALGDGDGNQKPDLLAPLQWNKGSLRWFANDSAPIDVSAVAVAAPATAIETPAETPAAEPTRKPSVFNPLRVIGIDFGAGDTTEVEFAGIQVKVNGEVGRSEATIDVTKSPYALPSYVYQTERFGPELEITLDQLPPDTPYLLRLHFVENQHSEKGQRSFSLDINGAAIDSAIDLLALTEAPHVAHVRDCEVTSDAKGRLQVKLKAGKDSATISALELLTKE